MNIYRTNSSLKDFSLQTQLLESFLWSEFIKKEKFKFHIRDLVSLCEDSKTLLELIKIIVLLKEEGILDKDNGFFILKDKRQAMRLAGFYPEEYKYLILEDLVHI